MRSVTLRSSGPVGDEPKILAADLNEHVRTMLTRLAKLGYNHDGKGSLPIREDVRDWADNHLFSWLNPAVSVADVRLPAVHLFRDGTLEIVFVRGLRSLRLRVLCRTVVLTRRTFDDGQTKIDGKLPGTGTSHDKRELDSLFAWLKEG